MLREPIIRVDECETLCDGCNGVGALEVRKRDGDKGRNSVFTLSAARRRSSPDRCCRGKRFRLPLDSRHGSQARRACDRLTVFRSDESLS